MLISDILGNSLSAAILIHTHQINNYLSFWVWSIICFPSRLVDEIPQVVSFLIFNVGQKMFLSAIEKQTEIKCLWLYLFGNGPIFVSVLLGGRDSLVVSFLIFDVGQKTFHYIIHCSGVIIGFRSDNVLGLLATATIIVEETLE